MSRSKMVAFIATVLMCWSIGCADRSPVAPGAPVASNGDANVRPGATAPGLYDLSFYADRLGAFVSVSSLVVNSDELILAAHITSTSGAAATSGSVTFEYCSYKGLPPNDITRADEAPLEACADGSADWARLTSIRMDAVGCPQLGPGYACMDFGLVRIPRVVGFRFRFSGQGTGIASGVSAPKNFTWTAS
jgi:hypothetical protein